MKNDRQGIRKFRGMPEISYGKCTRDRCRAISDLADGLCVECWDRTSYKCDLDTESEDCIEKSEKSESSFEAGRTGNIGYTGTFAH